MKYFYIVTFDGQIFEILYSKEKFDASLGAWQKGGLLLLKELGGGIHASSISKILDEDLYESYIFSVKPTLFIKDGSWYDGKERRLVRHENWKQKELDKVKKLEAPIYKEKTDEEIEATKKLLEKMKPDFLRK